jgi:UDP-2,3-diacylglucosamine hydrolase
VETLFISDLHLDLDRPEAIEACRNLITTRAMDAQALYILGDLFEYWVGDDDPPEGFTGLFHDLRKLTAAGISVYLMHGNRDFLIGPRLIEQLGATLLEDPSVVDLYGRPTLLMHGDTLCIDDVDYQAFRAMVRDPAWQQDFLSRPLAERIAAATQMRDGSRQAMVAKSEQIMDVNDATVAEAFREHAVDLLIHGHTHRPGLHRLTVDGRPCRRVVLGDWYETASLLSVGPDHLVLEDPRAPG